MTAARHEAEDSAVKSGSFEAFELGERRRRAFGLWKSGCSFLEISEALSVSQREVYHDVQWVERHGLGGPAGGLLGVAEIDRSWAGVKLWSELEVVKSEALKAWARSIKPRRKKVRKQVSGEKDNRTEETETIEQVTGDPRFLGIAKDVIHDQALLVGLIDDAKQGRGLAREVEQDVDDSETIAIIEVTSRDQARKLEGKRFCRVADTVESEPETESILPVVESPPEPVPVKPQSLAGIVGAKMKELPRD
jgi:hypothetical protein